MPTHYSKLEGSPSQRLLERRKRKLRTMGSCAATTTTATSFEDTSSMANCQWKKSSGNRLEDVPSVILVQNFRRLTLHNERDDIHKQPHDRCRHQSTQFYGMDHRRQQPKAADDVGLSSERSFFGSVSESHTKWEQQEVFPTIRHTSQNIKYKPKQTPLDNYELNKIRSIDSISTNPMRYRDKYTPKLALQLPRNNSFSREEDKCPNPKSVQEMSYRSENKATEEECRDQSFVETSETQATKWVCDVCKKARFDTYVEAFRHELECRKENAETSPEREASWKDKILWRRQAIQTGDIDAREPYHDSCGSTLSNEEVEWVCRVCKQVSFSSFSEACRHERSCQNRERVTTTKREPFVATCTPNPKLWETSAMTIERIHAIQQEATADLRDKTKGECYSVPIQENKLEEEDKTKGESYSVPIQENNRLEEEDKTKGESYSVPIQENKLEEEDKTKGESYSVPIQENNRLEKEDKTKGCVLERKVENSPYIIDVEALGKVYLDRFRAFGAQQQETPPKDCTDSKGKSHEESAYDRYIRLARQVEDECERKRYMDLAEETREEEMMMELAPSNDERYVCLA